MEIFYFIGFLVILLIADLCFFIRNKIVADFRLEVIKEVFSDDVEVWEEKKKEFDSVSYNEMLWKFWRRLDSFYPNLGKKVVIKTLKLRK